MNNYLLQLLKEVKTIIIPGLGAITLTNEQTGEMMFMSYLKFDDGNLAKHIAEKEGMDVNDAKNLIAKFVREVTAQIDKGESYDMYQFGSFRKVDGEVAFDQWQSGSAAAETPAQVVETPIEKHIVPEEKAAEIQAEEPVSAKAETTSIEEEIPVSETEAMGAAIAAAVIAEDATTDEPSVMEEIKEEKREEAVTAIVPEPSPKAPVSAETPVVELTDQGFKTENVPVPVVETPPVVHESPLPINEVPPVTKHEAGVAPSPKEIVEAKDAQKKPAPAPKKADAKDKPKKKTSVLAYILWGVVVLLLGGTTYVAVNYDTLKKDFPQLASLMGDDEETTNSKQQADSTATEEPDTTATEPAQEESAAVNQEETVPEVVEETPPPPPVVTEPAPKPSRPRKSNSGSSSIVIGKPDPATPFHVIGGSFSSEVNAKRFARELISKGQPSVMVGEFNSMYRVSISSFSTKEAALADLDKLKAIVPQAWVFKWP